MINVKELMEAKRVTITYQENDIDFKFVKMFRLHFGLTQIALANLMGVTKKTVEKWEQGKNKVNGSSAVLFTLLFENPELIKKLRQVKMVTEDGTEKEFKVVASNSFNIPQIKLEANPYIVMETFEPIKVTKSCVGAY